ncbi:SpoIVB peptidase [Clostridium sp. SHJSY1]|uniref:SpoIVB peptidase n=1 Tax=Clostridium sp. SHJSY1 TaxID=2942483 RepID=UPI00287484C1|nr:SpoIVB peptidase [Clostridium sp. SHJSY1]MDS0527865.1 SpoIVB peptidase [Clostridium sp. SHJSY1]
MKNRFSKAIKLIVTPILILVIMACLSISDVPQHLEKNRIQILEVFKEDIPFLKNIKVKNKFLDVFKVKSVSARKVDDIEVIPGGNSIGVKLSAEGVLVVGHSDVIVNNEKKESPAKVAGIEVGDLIVKVNGEKIEKSKDLIEKVKKSKSNKLELEIIRAGINVKKEVVLLEEKNDGYKIGLWVRDSTAGVGTMTFYDEKSGKFGALGHPVTDGETNEPFAIKEGELLKSTVISVKKGEKGLPGELRGIFQEEDNPLGKIQKNTQCGIFGDGNKSACKFMNKEPVHVALRNEIKVGKASIITTVDENGPKEYEIEVVKLFEQSEPGPKSMIIKITDEELISKTGGIVQGMSGSPIIQNGKIIGAVTHVLINKPDVGYGIYIDWMLEDVGIIK